METFVFLWQLLESHGVIPGYKADCARLWNQFSIEQQRAIYGSIRDKLRTGKFVHYNPVKAIQENAPKQKQQQTLSYNDYYARFGTTEEQPGWQRVFLPEQHKTIFVKQ